MPRLLHTISACVASVVRITGIWRISELLAAFYGRISLSPLDFKSRLIQIRLQLPCPSQQHIRMKKILFILCTASYGITHYHA